MLEDSEAGIQSAVSAEIPVICVPDMKTPRDELLQQTESTLSSLHEVITWLEARNN